MVGYIYLITDTTNGMKYTGQHHYHIEGQLDPNYHGSGTIISKIYKKRPETLKEEYIKTCYSEEEMNSDEQYYIKLFKTLYPNGYNLTEGGDGCVASEETRRKLSQNHYDCSGENHPNYGKKASDETRKKMSDSHKGKPSPNKGKKMSEEQKKKMSESKKGIPNIKLSKKVLQYTLDGEFVREWSSIAECSQNGYAGQNICKCCQGKRKSAYGFKWCYAGE